MLSEKELRRYDRQVMIFGTEAQKKSKKGKSSYHRIGRIGLTYQHIFNGSGNRTVVFN